MREILFRGKRVDNGEWVEGYFAQHKDRCAILRFRVPELNAETADEWIKGYGFFEVDPETVCQYTELTDKTGRKSFEGDIVMQYADTTELGKDLYYFYKICWNKNHGYFEGVEIYSGETFLFPDLEDFEVIGNIFDNHDLLTTSSTDSD